MNDARDPSSRSSLRRSPWLSGAGALAALAAAALVRRAAAPSPSAVRAAALRALSAALPARRAFAVELWDGSELPATAGPATARLVIRAPESLGRMLRLPLDVAMGEAYLRGDYDIEGDVGQIVGLADTLTPPAPARLAGLLRDVDVLRRAAGDAPPPPVARLAGEAHSRARDRDAVSYHYDVSNAFYALWLDRAMVYSCGYFPRGDETLDEAQAAKLDLVCRKLRLRPGERLLDLGCGWGGLAIHAARHHGARVLGVTLSEEQLREGRSRVRAAGLSDRVSLELLDYRDVRGEFDKIASVGMAEHVGRRRMGAYFRRAHALLRPGGLMLHHAISAGLGQARVSNLVQSGNFARKYVFPDGELLPIWETQQHAEDALFEVRDVENLREHYARTVALWAANLEGAREAALAEVGPARLRLWWLYLHACAYYFERGHLSIFQTLLAKPDAERRVDLPRSRADLYAP